MKNTIIYNNFLLMINQHTNVGLFSHGNYVDHTVKPSVDSYHIQHKISQGQHFSQKRMKQLVEQMRFKEKMQNIDRKKGRYKRSTNNCHKKYIGILKNLLFLKLSNQLKNEILNLYNQFKNSRVYYFIILGYLKWYLTTNQIRWIFQHFCKEVESKIARYKLQIQTTNNINFINFRKDQIVQMQYSIHSVNYYLRGKLQQSIKMLYQKNKYIIIKRNQYLRTTKIVDQLEKSFEQRFQDVFINEKLSNLNLEEIYIWKNQAIIHDERNQVKPCEQYKDRNEHYSPVNQEYSQEDHKLSQEEPRINQVNLVKVEQNLEYEFVGPSLPLIGLQNSYPAITDANWFSWITQKQKQMQIYMRYKEESLARIYASNRINFNQYSSFHFPPI